MGRRRLAALFGTAALTAPLIVGTPVLAGRESAVSDSLADPYRPELHFSPAQHWVNDPNGPVWYRGEYHLFFQHNPEGDQWGNMSWGHAVSTDLLTWEERPVAIPWTEREHIFSGSVVVDEDDTSGFGRPGEPALVAAYTSWDPVTGIQAQSVAYSVDAGETWTAYAGNPVLDLGSREFRDPKVFWYEDGGYWVMAVVLATEHKVQLYRSDDLKAWTHLSDFGPSNAVGGVWEMPDLFELPVDGDPDDTRWVMVVNLNPGAIAGGSGAQYFVGDFDGTAFTAENVVTDAEAPAGTVVADFDGGTYPAGWTTSGDAFGERPATGTLPGQQTVSGFRGTGLVNSFLGQDGPQGTLTSPDFTLTDEYVNLLVGGGNHPSRAGTGDGSAPAGRVFADFEGPGYGDWTVAGTAFGSGPVAGDGPCQDGVTGYVGGRLANSYQNSAGDPCNPPPDSATGSLTSPQFTVTEPYISFLVGGGPHAETAVRLLVDGEVVRSTSGAESGRLDWASWDVSDLEGRQATIEVRDASTGGWGHVLADHFVFSAAPALPRSTETTVNLVVDGRTVRTATGQDSEELDWVAWNVSDLVGQDARVVVVDSSSGGWGHILVDHVMLSEEPALSALERYRWMDYGTDYYAALTFENTPGDERVAIAWMNNWQYAGATPTDGWRGSMTLPRELTLETVDGDVRLVSQPVDQVASAAGAGGCYVLRNRVVDDTVLMLPERAEGAVLEIAVEFELGDADEFGLHVRAGGDERTVVGYDVTAGALFVDRTASGDVGFHPTFPGVHSGPVSVRDGTVSMTVYVDRSSVEVFGGSGETTITDLVYPSAGSDGVGVYAEGGDVKVRSLTVQHLDADRP